MHRTLFPLMKLNSSRWNGASGKTAASIQRVATVALSDAKDGAGETMNWHRQIRPASKFRLMGE